MAVADLKANRMRRDSQLRVLIEHDRDVTSRAIPENHRWHSVPGVDGAELCDLNKALVLQEQAWQQQTQRRCQRG
jgi:hypothetical protein